MEDQGTLEVRLGQITSYYRANGMNVFVESCQVRIFRDVVILECPDGEGGLELWEGIKVGEGHWALSMDNDTQSYASLHKTRDDQCYEGSWNVCGRSGMWSITLVDEGEYNLYPYETVYAECG